MTEPTITLMRGIQGSGKTTQARIMAKDGRVRISRDDIRQQLYGTLWGPPIDEDLVTKVETSMALSSLRAGVSVIIDATHLYQRHVNRWQKLGYPVEIFEIAAPLGTLLTRNMRREKAVPERVIEENFKKFVKDPYDGTLKPVKLNPEWYITSNFEPYVPNEWLDQAYIFDIDGTLAHMDGKRSPYDYSKVGGDRVDERVRSVLRSLREEHFIVLVSGRKAECMDDTIAWLRDNHVDFDELHMRAADDSRPDTIVKYEILKDKIAPKYNVLGAFDDRNSVVAMWRNVGVKCYHVEEGDF